MPYLEIVPNVGFKPKIPVNDAGLSTEPPVCEPIANGIILSETAAAEPEEDPPGVHSKSFGFFVLPGPDSANSVVTHLPIITAPASLNNLTKCASSDGLLFLHIEDPFSVGMSLVSIMSLIPIGRPLSFPGFLSFHL